MPIAKRKHFAIMTFQWWSAKHDHQSSQIAKVSCIEQLVIGRCSIKAVSFRLIQTTVESPQRAWLGKSQAKIPQLPAIPWQFLGGLGVPNSATQLL